MDYVRTKRKREGGGNVITELGLEKEEEESGGLIQSYGLEIMGERS